MLFGARRYERCVYRMIEDGLTGRLRFFVCTIGGDISAVDKEERESYLTPSEEMSQRQVDAQKAKFRIGGHRYQQRVFRALDNRETGEYILHVQIKSGIIKLCRGEGGESYL